MKRTKIRRPFKFPSLRSVLIVIAVCHLLCSCTDDTDRVLVFSKTEGFRHKSIEAGTKALQKLGTEHGFEITGTEDASYFVEDSLALYAAVVFLNTTQDVLNAPQQADFERYIQAGGGFVGIHAATDTEYDWPWYQKLVGAVFEGHPEIQEATLRTVDSNHPATETMDSVLTHTDEWYNFKNIHPNIHVLVTIDEDSYEGGTNGKQHPISWYQEYDGGRSFYTAMGHAEETFQNKVFLSHLLGGIRYAIGAHDLNYALATTERIPPEDRFVKKILDFNLNEPMELDELPGKGILFVERRGALKLYDFQKEATTTVADMDVFYGNEDGLLGLAVDPNYEENHWIYLFYSVEGAESMQHISRFDLVDGELDRASEKVLLTIPTDRHCCHSGGALEFGPDGNLFITVGDNTNPFESSGFAPMDEREGRKAFDAQRSAANTNDLRGKILRITPEPDGTYSIPEGNLFPKGTPKTRPEIYVMGCRNPFRPSIDSQTGYLYWGDIGPDAGRPDPDRGPSGMGEYDQARKAGFWGWPFTRGFNEAYNDYDFDQEVSGPKFDPQNLVNDSPNNTGIMDLPPAQPSMIPMTYYRSEEFPWMGTGGINPMAGPVYHASDHPEATNPFPDYFEDKLFLYEWMRDWVFVITLDENQDYVRADPFMPQTEFSHPMDMIFGSDGHLYVLEYGQKWNAQNLDARLSRISYIEGNRNPIAKIGQDKTLGGAPLTVRFSAANSIDYDREALSYAWSFDGTDVQSTEQEPTFTFSEEGIYTVRLTVTDPQGNTDSALSKIMVGNDAPEIRIETLPNDTIYWEGKQVAYQVEVSDKQDGPIEPDDVTVSFEYIPEGRDMIRATVGHQRNIAAEGKAAIEASDCKACHAIDEMVNGPSYQDIALKYNADDTGYLVSKIIKGGSNVWGERAMAAHPQLTVSEVSLMVEYILSLKPEPEGTTQSLPLKGNLRFDEHSDSPGEGVYVLMASYRDKGHPQLPDAELAARARVIFTAKKLEAETATAWHNDANAWSTNYSRVVGPMVHEGFLQFNDVALKNLENITLALFHNGNYDFKGTVEIREGALDGPLIGSANVAYMGDEKTGYYEIAVRPENERATLFVVFKNPETPARNIGHADYLSLHYKR